MYMKDQGGKRGQDGIHVSSSQGHGGQWHCSFRSGRKSGYGVVGRGTGTNLNLELH